MTQEEKDYVEFEKTQFRRIYESKYKGLAKKYKFAVELEIEGIEGILEYLPENARAAIQERCNRMRRNIEEIK